jgi:hypothetical protein
VDKEVLELLCPEGITEDAQASLKDGLVDVLALPGKGGSLSEAADLMAQSMSEAVNLTKGARDSFLSKKDMQWDAASKNVLKSILTYQQLKEKSAELRELRDQVLLQACTSHFDRRRMGLCFYHFVVNFFFFQPHPLAYLHVV